MERLGTLIEKLNGQYASGAGGQEMLVTLQMLQNELLLQNGQPKKNGTKGISVFMPGQFDLRFSNEDIVTGIKPVMPQEKQVFELDPEIADGDVVTDHIGSSSLHEMPTFTRQPQSTGTTLKEVNETVVAERPSINEILEGSPKPELGSRLQPGPIKDLRKAISINDRHQFVNHLFKGDETMYERSIKTINAFNVFSEASFWIRRELAVKLSWRDDDLLVQQFNQLVSRRFM